MGETIYLIVAIVQVFALIIAMPKAFRVTIYMMLRKNPEWIKAHPEFTVHKTIDRISTGFHVGLGIIGAAAIFLYAIIIPSPDYYWELMAYPLFSMFAVFTFVMSAQYFWLARSIPKPEAVKASLTSRRLSDFVPMWTYYLGNALGAVIIALHVNAIFKGFEGAYFGALGAILFLYTWVNGWLYYYLRWKYSENEEVFGSATRKIEAIGGVALLYLVAILCANILWKVYFGAYFFAPLTMNMMIIASVYIGVIYYSLHPKTNKTLAKYEDNFGIVN